MLVILQSKDFGEAGHNLIGKPEVGECRVNLRGEGVRKILIVKGGGLCVRPGADYDGLHEDGEGVGRGRYVVRLRGKGEAGCIVAAEYEVAVVALI